MAEEPQDSAAPKTAEVDNLRKALAELEERNRRLEFELARLNAGQQPQAQEQIAHDLLLSDEKFRLAFQINPDPCCITRARDGAFIEVNPAFEAISGYSRQEVLASNSLALNFYPDPEVRSQLVKDVAAHGQVLGREVRFRTRKGQMISTLMSLGVFMLGGEPHIISNIKVIHDLKIAQEKLSASEERYRRIVETANEGIWVVDDQLVTTFVNQRLASMFGYTVQEMLGQTLESFVHPEELEDFHRRAVQRSQGQNEYLERRYRRKDGSDLYALVSATTLMDRQGRQVGRFAMLADITQSKRAEEALRDSETKFRQLAENIEQVFWLVSPDWNQVHYISPAYEKVWGRPCQELYRQARSWLEQVVEEDREALRAAIPASLTPATELTCPDYRIKRPDGAIRWISARAFPVTGPDGKVWRVAGIAEDITQRKRAEEEIRLLNQGLEKQVAERTASLAAAVTNLQSEIARHRQARQELEASNRKYSTLLEHTLQGVAILEGNPAHFAYVNSRMSEIFGYSAREFTELGPEEMWKLVHPEDREMVRQRALSRLAGQTPPSRYEFRIVRKDGGLRWVEVFSAPTEHQGRPASQITYIDMTEHKQAEEALRQSEEKFAVAFRHSPALMALTVVEDGTYLDINDKFRELLGLERQQVIGRTSTELGWLRAEDRQRVLDTLESQGRVTGMKITSFKPDGTPVPCSYHCELVNIGGRQRLLTIALDMSQYQLAEEALRKSEERYRLLVESANEGIVVAQDGMAKFLNQRMLEIVGLSTEEAGDRPFIEYVHPDDRASALERYEKRLDGDTAAFNQPVRIVDNKGLVKWLALNSVLIEWEGRPAALCFFTDITQRMQAERDLRESQERYRLISENASDIVVLYDAGMGVRYVSPSVRQVLGYSPQEFMQLALPDLLHTDDAQGPYLEAMTRLQGEQADAYMQCRMRRRDGSYVWLEILAAPTRGEAGRITGYLASARDISQRRRAEEALLHLAAGVAHNFNNVLMATLSNAQAAQGLLTRGQGDGERLGDLLENVVQATLNGRDVVHRLSRFVSGRQEQSCSTEVVDLNPLLASLPGLVQGMTAPGSVRLELKLQEGLLVNGMPGELMEVFLNLAKNAVEAMPRGGLLEVTAQAQGRMAVIEFADNGLGADQATLARFFEPFFSTKGAQGQGLGLSVSQAIARSHGGDISARSRPGQGATLAVRLPLSQEQPPAAPVESARPVKAAPLKLLLVEDEGLVAMGMTLALESAGHQVLHVVTMAGALAIMDQFRPDLVICDLGLPDATGWEVCARLDRQAAELGLKPLPMVVLSGWGREQLGTPPPGTPQPFAYLQKPTERSRLLEVIAQAAASR